MNRALRLLALVLLPVLLAAPALEPPLESARPVASAAPDRPDIVLLVADDLALADLVPGRFPNIDRLRRDGTTLSEFVVTDSWCCPSRASILRSQYVHSHGVKTNNPPDGGYAEFRERGEDRSTVGTWMRDAGYRTALFGKFLNGYPTRAEPDRVPPGWDAWAVPRPGAVYSQRDYTLIERGTAPPGPQRKHLDDEMGRRASAFVRDTPQRRPFFLYLAPVAPHRPAPHADRHAGAFAGIKAPRGPSFDQDDLAAEPAWLRAQRPLGPKRIAKIDRIYRNRMRSMLAVDEMLGDLTATLKAQGRLDSTYLFFTSDNGFHLGEHRLPPGKTTPFEEDVHVPLIVSGPGIAAGKTVDTIAGTVDLAPTVADLGGARVPAFAEGRSMAPLLKRGGRPANWRDAMLVEFFAGHSRNRPEGPDCDTRPPGSKGCPRPPGYAALRTDRHTYVEYATGERQLYDLRHDPHQLRNLAATADPELVRTLSGWLAAYRTCAGATCRGTDRRPLPSTG